MKDMYQLNQIPSEAQIRKFLRRTLFGKNVFCPRCHCREVWRDKERYWCPRCRRRFTLLSYTWLHDLKLPLHTWWLVLWAWCEKIPVHQAMKLSGLSELAVRRWYDRFREHLPENQHLLSIRKGGIMLTKKRIGEISVILLNYRYKEKGMRIALSEKRNFYNVAKAIGVSGENLEKFALRRIGDLLKSVFNIEIELAQLDPEEEGEIAFRYVKYLLKKDGMTFLEVGRNEIEKISEDTKLFFDEVCIYYREVGISITEDSFGKER